MDFHSTEECRRMREDAYDPTRTMRNTAKGPRRHYYNMEVDDSQHIGLYPYLRQQAEDAIEVITSEEFLDRLATKSSMGNILRESLLYVGDNKHLHSEGCAGLPIAREAYFQDPHNDWRVDNTNISAYRTSSICPFSVMSSHEPQGSWLRLWLNCPGKLECPAIADYADVFIPQGAILVWRGDVTHCGLGYLKDNRRIFRYVGVRSFPGGYRPYNNAVLLSREFATESHRVLVNSLPIDN